MCARRFPFPHRPAFIFQRGSAGGAAGDPLDASQHRDLVVNAPIQLFRVRARVGV